MASKSLLVFGLLLATALLLSSEIAAEHSKETNANGEGLKDEKYGGGGYPGGGGGYPGGGGGYPGHGGGGGGYPGHGGGGGGYPGHGGGGGGYPGHGGGGRCYYGCCRHGYNGCICCSTATEKPNAEFLPEPKH